MLVFCLHQAGHRRSPNDGFRPYIMSFETQTNGVFLLLILFKVVYEVDARGRAFQLRFKGRDNILSQMWAVCVTWSCIFPSSHSSACEILCATVCR